MIITVEGEEAVIYSILIGSRYYSRCFTPIISSHLIFKAYFPKYQALTKELKVEGFGQGQHMAQFKVQIGSQ